MAPLLVWRRRLLPVLSCAVVMVLFVLYRRLQPGELPLPSLGKTEPILPYHTNFEYLLNPPICGPGGVGPGPGGGGVGGGGEEPVRAVFVVHSDPRHPEVRQAIRDSLPADELAALGLRRAFMVAEASTQVQENETTIPQSAIEEESARYGDLVQGNFHDSYHNLTYKHIMALDWAVTFCPQARYIIKMDDDIVYNVYELMKVLHFVPSARYLGGNAFKASPPYRGVGSKWSVSPAEWPRQLYPPYVSGWLYITSQDVARALVMQSTVVPFFWIDDTYVTGILAEQLSITIRALNVLFATNPECVRRTVSEPLPPEDQDDTAASGTRTVLAPSVVVAPTDRDLEALKAFNNLCRYCSTRPCGRRRKEAVCANILAS